MENQERRRKGIYLLPNLFTTGTLFAGFFAIVSAIQGHFTSAAVGIFLAMVADGLDGRVARLTNTQSDFGKEYDSLSDCIAFGLAAALVIYVWALQYLGDYGWAGAKLGWLAAFLYAAAAALRLARFNVHPLSREKQYFYGLPSPSGAAVTAGFVWFGQDLGLSGAALAVPAFIITLGAAVLMVSTIKYYSFKEVKLSERVPFVYILVVVLAFALIAINPARVLFIAFLLYALSGPLMALRRRLRRG